MQISSANSEVVVRVRSEWTEISKPFLILHMYDVWYAFSLNIIKKTSLNKHACYVMFVVISFCSEPNNILIKYWQQDIKILATNRYVF